MAKEVKIISSVSDTSVLNKIKKLPRYDHALRTDGGSGWVEHYLNGD